MLSFRVLGYDRDRFAWVPLCEFTREKDVISAALAIQVAKSHVWVAAVQLVELKARHRADCHRPQPPDLRVVHADAPHPERLPTLPEFRAAAFEPLPAPAEVRRQVV